LKRRNEHQLVNKREKANLDIFWLTDESPKNPTPPIPTSSRGKSSKTSPTDMPTLIFDYHPATAFDFFSALYFFKARRLFCLLRLCEFFRASCFMLILLVCRDNRRVVCGMLSNSDTFFFSLLEGVYVKATASSRLPAASRRHTVKTNPVENMARIGRGIPDCRIANDCAYLARLLR
jgi:hypothetical protein